MFAWGTSEITSVNMCNSYKASQHDVGATKLPQLSSCETASHSGADVPYLLHATKASFEGTSGCTQGFKIE
jgi:hypothetical protein